ncbi:MAG: undecaprenyldiphospho-muramoylpentapeptide beta-N-acetylglucosaminyltransferase [bacterium]
MNRLMVMAGGTGGHVMPALAVARKLRDRGIEISWMGNADGLEARLVPEAGFELEFIQIKGLRNSGWRRKLAMPYMLFHACIQAFGIIRRRQPDALLGMGGFVSGPGGLVAGLLGKPLVLHEQNAVAGLTNRWLSHIARRVLSGFPEAAGIRKVTWVGNPVRDDIAAISPPERRLKGRVGPLRILIVGGSQGARVFNRELPRLLSDQRFPPLEIMHQCGEVDCESVKKAYHQQGIAAEINSFIDDMAVAYRWCDIVICRAGAMTVSEVCAAGAVALFVPYPYAVNGHQTKNAAYVKAAGASLVCEQSQFVKGEWISQIVDLSNRREILIDMANNARTLARPNAALELADICEGFIHA